MRRSIPLAVLLAAALLLSPGVQARQAQVTETVRTIPTYSFSDPDPVPILLRRPQLYPYFAFDGYRTEAEPVPWQVVQLENDYLRVLVLPQVGGKVWGAVEKSTGQEFIYQNEVLKFRQIALRGPWTSGGSEFNFGIVGHTPATATPVDYLTRENPDGSVSCFVGTLDLPSRTRWSVEIRVPPEAALFELRSLWYNPTPYHQPYYVWTNNAVPVGEDLQFFFPGDRVVPHGEEVVPGPWPVDAAGRDLSWYRYNDFGGSKSHFVLGALEEFYGGYWHDRGFGFGHWALYDDMPGKKMWIWALSREGAIWEGLLTDTDGQYSEPQAGRLFSQSDHEFFPPHAGDSWSEVLFPFLGIGGLVKASPWAALNVERDQEGLTLALCALQPLADELVVRRDGEEVLRVPLDLVPLGIWRHRLTLSGDPTPVVVEIPGKLRWDEDPRSSRITRPIRFTRPDERTAEGLFQAGESLAKQRRYNDALERYLACLEREPRHGRALTRTAELYCRRGEYTRALEFAGRALEDARYDPDAGWVYAAAARALGRTTDARETLGWAARSLAYRSGAWCRIAELLLAQGQPDLAADYARRALDYDRFDLRAHEVLAIALRIGGRRDEAARVLEDLLAIAPLDHLARFEQYLLAPSPAGLERFTSLIRSELPWEHYLEIGVFYAVLGRPGEAVQVLESSPPWPVVDYWLAWLQRERDPVESDRRRRRAASTDPRLVFPFREETLPVLEWAAGRDPSDWRCRWYLGLILWSRGRTGEALERFAACGDPAFAPFHLVLARLLPEQALEHLRRAAAVDPVDWRTGHALIAEHTRRREYAEALALATPATGRFPAEVVVRMDEASALYNTGRYADCLTRLEWLDVLPYEGGWEAHDLWLRTQVQLAAAALREGRNEAAVGHLAGARDYPEHLGTGAPFEPDQRLEDYLEAVTRDRQGERAQAQQARERAAAYTLSHGLRGAQFDLFGLLALRESGRTGEADRLAADLARTQPTSTLVRWTLASYAGDRAQAVELETRLEADPRTAHLVAARRAASGR